MKTFLAIIMYSLSLFGIDIGSHTFVDRIRVDGADTLYSKVVTQPTGTRFECLRSESGQCYYTVYPRDCTPTSTPTSASADPRAQHCLSKPVEHFALAKGDSRQIPALHGFRLCVSAEAGSVGPDCDMPELMAAR